MRSQRTTLIRTIATAFFAATGGCLPSFPSRPARTAEPLFDPATFFSGRTHGAGTVEVRWGAVRVFRVEGTGRRAPDGTFRLDQTITFADNTVEARTWRMRRVSAGRFTATLSDAKGEVTAESSGNLFHLRYLLRQPAMYMEQWLYLKPDGQSAENLAQVTVMGVPWARLTETITRVDAAAQ